MKNKKTTKTTKDKKVMETPKWDIKDFINNIKSEQDNQGFLYYFWHKLPKEATVNESTEIGHTVFRAQDLVGKSNISKKFEYTFLGISVHGLAKIRKSKYDVERLVNPRELCKQWMSTYAKNKKIENLTLKGEMFYIVDTKTKKKINKKLLK